jgi:hypothetical protein
MGSVIGWGKNGEETVHESRLMSELLMGSESFLSKSAERLAPTKTTSVPSIL